MFTYTPITDDEPDDGPQHYVIIKGFDQAPLLILLGDVGVFVDSIIKIKSQDYARFEKKDDDEEEEEEDEKSPEGMFNVGYRFKLQIVVWQEKTQIYVMRSSKMSLNSKTNKNLVFITLYASISKLYHAESHQNWTYGSRDIAILVMLKTIKCKGNEMLLLAVSRNQY